MTNIWILILIDCDGDGLFCFVCLCVELTEGNEMEQYLFIMSPKLEQTLLV